ncbi:hypothetical protein ABK040_014961 [Willaertia magna]
MWKWFSKSARCIINQQLQFRTLNNIKHLTISNCDPQVFYLGLCDNKGGKFYQWYQDVLWNGIKQRINCIQFRFNNCIPALDNFNNWSENEINHEYNSIDNVKYITKHKINIDYISLTCNIETGEVWSSFKFKKQIDFGNGYEKL